MNSNSKKSSSSGMKFSSLESEVLLSELYCKLNTFPHAEKTKVVTSWLANSYADLTNTGARNSDLLNYYIVHVRLFNTLANNSPFDELCLLAECFLNDFLNPFIVPGLTETGGNFCDATYYFRIACEHITQPLLVRRIIGLVISQLLPPLLSRLVSKDPDMLVSTLGLFKVLLEFYCEDFWYELILQYLLPMKHLLVSERQKSLPDISFSDSTVKFLDLIPDCITDTLNPDILAEHFILYIQEELNRLNDIDSTLTKGVPLSKSEVTGIPLVDNMGQPSESERLEMQHEERNPIFPLWAFKYDGTDVLHASRKYSFVGEPEEYFEDDLFNNALAIFNQPTVNILPDANIENTSLNNERLLEASTNDSETVTDDYPTTRAGKRKSDDVTHAAYLGPFLDSLYNLLDQWTRIEPEVIVMVSEIFSVLASSRLPLISYLMLDLNTILQPCYPSFSAIIHTIRTKLDGSMKKYPTWFIKNIWQKSSVGSSALLKSENDGPPQGDTLKEKILNSHPFTFVSKLSRGSNLVKLFTSNSTLLDNRILNRSASGFETDEEEAAAKKMTLRCILFVHWLLELGAIAQQICWSQSRNPPGSDY